MGESSALNNRRRRARRESGESQLTQAAENYLLSIFMVGEQGLPVTNLNLVAQLKRTPESEGLGTSPPSVAGMVKRMSDDNLITVSDSREIQLTPRGNTLAESIVRRHRLAERMIVDLLGLNLANAHVEAHRLEHAISPELLSKIASRLGNPQTCPFGHPIPGSGQPTPGQNPVTLGQASLATRHMIDRVPEHDNDLLRFLVDEEILPGREIVVTDTAPYRGVLTIAGPLGHDVALGLDIASRIWVHPI